MNKKKLIELRCKAWGITEDEYYCNQCSDFSLEDMARAYRRGKNKGRDDLLKEITELKCECRRCVYYPGYSCIPSDFGKDRIGICNHFKDVFDENVELKEELNYAKTHCLFYSDCPTQKELAVYKSKVETLSGDIPWSELKDKSEVIKENVELKETNKQLISKCECLTKRNDGLQDLLSNDIDTLEQLIKAKELLTKFVKTSVYFNGKETCLVDEAERFLTKNEKCEK